MALLKQERLNKAFEFYNGIFKRGSLFDDDGANIREVKNVVHLTDNVVEGADNVVL